MIKRTKSLFILLAMVIGITPSLLGCGRGIAMNSLGNHTVLNFAFELPENHPWGVAAYEFKRIVEEKSDGELLINLFPNGSLAASGREIQEGAKIGTVDIGISSTPMSQLIPKVDLFSMPYLFNDREHAWRVLDSNIATEIGQELATQQLEFLAFWEDGFRQITTGNKDITTVSDFNGLKIRVPESELRINTFKALGATPISMPWSEVFTGLQQGAVDGQENPLSVIASASFFDVQDHLIISNHVYSPATVFMNKEKFDSLSPEHQVIIKDAMDVAKEINRTLNEQEDENLQEELKNQGMKVTVIEDIEEFRMATDQVRQDMIDSFPDAADVETLVDQMMNMKDEGGKLQ